MPLKTATEANDSTTVTNTLSVTKASAVAGYADTKYTLLGDKASVFGLNCNTTLNVLFSLFC